MKRIKKSALGLIFFILLGLSPAYAIFNEHYKGSAAGKFLTFAAFSNVKVFNNGGAGISGYPENVYFNPAGLFRLTRAGVSTSFVPYYGGTRIMGLCFGAPFISKTSIGFGWKYLTDKQEGYDVYGVSTGEFKNSAMELAFSLARKVIWKLQGGISVKLLNMHLQEKSAFAAALDIGVSGRAFGGSVDYGIVVQNLGTGIKFENAREPLPLVLKGGIYYEYENFSIASDLIVPRDDLPSFSFGYGYKFRPNFSIRTSFIVDDRYIEMDDLGLEFIFKAAGVDFDVSINPHTAGSIFGTSMIFTIRKFF